MRHIENSDVNHNLLKKYISSSKHCSYKLSLMKMCKTKTIGQLKKKGDAYKRHKYQNKVKM